MNDEFHQLTTQRIKWVEATQENGFDEGIKRLLTDLYPDNAHFIYELLQNAEDAGATKVEFKLSNDGLEFIHDGERLFSIKDVDSITSIGNSTKRDDPTSIGKFGVGFKAVFAYTNTPKVRSGDFAFRIEELVIPRLETSETKNTVRSTCFIFPFNNPNKLPDQARKEIESALLNLTDNTLLFLSNIRWIEYSLADGGNGWLFRQEASDGKIKVACCSPLDFVESNWLRFEKKVKVQDDDGQSKDCRIAIAYRLLEEEQKKTEEKRWVITPVKNGQVSIYFPAEKETSNLRFHMHAPFASTVARDSVRDCRANEELRDQLAELIVESVVAIRDMGLLSVGFLGVLPNPLDSLPEFYEPIRRALVEAFSVHDLTPTRTGVHAPASTLYRGPARIAEVLDDEDLAFLTSTQPPLWAANPPQQNQREDRFLESLEIPQWGWTELVESLEESNSNALIFADEQESEYLEQAKKVEAWIADKSDAWLLRYYSLLGEACDVHGCCVDIDYLKIIRVATEGGHDHVYPREAYISIGEEQTHSMDVNLVKSSVYLGGRSEYAKKYAAAFLENVGIKPLDAKVAIEKTLEEYNVPGANSTSKSSHLSHIRQFLFHISNHPSDIGLFRSAAFVLAKDLSGSEVFVSARKICLDSPYMETGLGEFEEIHGRFALSSFYKGKLKKNEVADLLDLLLNLGAMKQLEIVSASIWTNPDRGLWDGTLDGRNTVTGIDEDYTIRSLDEYLCEEKISASKLIWKAITTADAKVRLARYRPNKGYETRVARSQLVCALSLNEWIPNTDGIFCRPQDITRNELHEEFIYDDRNGLLTEIGFGESEKRLSEEYKNKNERAQELGFESADKASKWAQLDKLGISPDELLAKSKVIEQPESPVPNPDRRRKGVQERQENAPTKESITRERKIQPGLGPAVAEAKAYLRPNYTNRDGELACQCCHDEMPFKVNDAYYFEAVQCIPRLKKNHIENRLALCPTCSAMYQYARITADEEIIRLLVDHEAPDDAPAVEIPISLAGKSYTLRFVGKHWFDLKTLLED